jgi:hypothetical protein
MPAFAGSDETVGSSCPQANLIERACGDVHDQCTRNHTHDTHERMCHLVQNVKHYLQINGLWRYALPELYYTPRRSQRTSRPCVPLKLHQRRFHNLPLECTNVVWSDLGQNFIVKLWLPPTGGQGRRRETAVPHQAQYLIGSTAA